MRARAIIEAESRIFRKRGLRPSTNFIVALRITRRDGTTTALTVPAAWYETEGSGAYTYAEFTEKPAELFPPLNTSHLYTWDFIHEIITYALVEGPEYGGCFSEDGNEYPAEDQQPSDIVRVIWSTDERACKAAHEASYSID